MMTMICGLIWLCSVMGFSWCEVLRGQTPAPAPVSKRRTCAVSSVRRSRLCEELRTSGESAQVMAIRANTLAEFAAEVDRIVQAQLLAASRAGNVRTLRRQM